jgi:cell division protein FtsN
MTTVDLFARIAIGWLTLSAIVGGAYMLAMARHKARATRRAEHVNWIAVLPPVPAWDMKRPPITQREIDETWLDAWPTEVQPADIDTLEQRVYDRLFDELVAIEGLEP